MKLLNYTKSYSWYSALVVVCILDYFLLYFLNRDIARVGAYLLGLVGLVLIYVDYKGKYNKEFFIWLFVVFCISFLLAFYLHYICCKNIDGNSRSFLHFLILTPFVAMVKMLNGWLRYFLVASILFILSGIFAYSFSDYPIHSAKYFESHYAVYLLLAPIMYVVSKSNVKENTIFIIFISSGIMIGLAALADSTDFARSPYWFFDAYDYVSIEGEKRIGASLNPIHFALFATSILSVVTTGFIIRFGIISGYSYVLLSLASILFLIFAVVGSGTRGSWMSFPLIVLIPLIYSPAKAKFKLVILVIVAMVSVGLYQVPSVKNRITLMQKELHMYLESADMEDPVRRISPIGVRLELWKASWEAFENNPVFGVGPGNFGRYMQDHNFGSSGKYHNKIGARRNSHSLYFKAISERGFLGILTVLLILGLPILFYYQQVKTTRNFEVKKYAISGLLIVIVFAIGGLTIGSLHKTDLSIFYVFSTALFCGLLMSLKRID